jgi:hypothetical protein
MVDQNLPSTAVKTNAEARAWLSPFGEEQPRHE